MKIRQHFSKPYFKYILWFTYFLIILITALLPLKKEPLEGISDNPSDFFHILAFVVFMLLTGITFPKLKWFWMVLIGMGFGLVIELFQLWFTGGVREFSLEDMGYDAVGIVIGMILSGLKVEKLKG